MISHIVLLSFVPEATAEQREAVAVGLRELPGIIPEIRSYQVGHDLGLAPGTSSFGITAEFDSVADYEVYRDHPAHQRVITELIGPIRAGRAAIQFEC